MPIPRIRIRKRSVSIQDVADRAAVSIATVSRAVNKPHLVAPETAVRVQQAIEELGYRPNRFAQGLMTQRSGLLGIALPDIHGEFYSEILRGADAEARRLGYQVLVSSLPAHPEPGVPPVALTRALGFVDGVAVMITEPDERVAAILRELNLPMVGIDASLEDANDFALIDHNSGARTATEHLLTSTPAADCFFVGGSPQNIDTRHRAQAFTRCLETTGHALRPDQVQFSDYSIAWGERWAQNILPTRGDRPTAVFGANDEIAYGVMRAALDMGLPVPGRVRVIGFDGSTLSSIVRPGLSTVRVPRDELGRLAIRALVGRVEDPDAPISRVVLATELIVRESSSP